MKTSERSKNTRPRFWDILVVRQDGQWVGFRAPWPALRRTTTFFSFIFVVCTLSLTGWLVCRWQVQRLERELSFEKLRNQSMGVGDASPHAGLAGLGTVSYLPRLDSEDVTVGTHELNDFAADYNATTQEVAVKFEITKKIGQEPGGHYYWFLLLHGPQGILSFSPNFASRSGDLMVYQRGQMIEDLKVKKSISARYKLSDFVQIAGSEPIFATIVVYDQKGTLVLKQRRELPYFRRRRRVGAAKALMKAQMTETENSPASETVFWDSLQVLANQHWITESFRGRGDIEFSGNLRFSGQWTGSISSTESTAHLYVMKDGNLVGTIRVENLSVEGTLRDVDVEVNSFRALKGAKIFGRIRAKTLVIEEGALIEGRVVSIDGE